MKTKKVILLTLALCLLAGLCACNDPGSTAPTETMGPTQQNNFDPTGTPFELAQNQVPDPQIVGTVPENPADANIPWSFGESPVPGRRTGIKRQGIPIGKFYEYTDTGVYFITDLDSMLLYADYGSDVFIPVCTRPDCTHTGISCDARINQPLGICSYEGQLYLGEGTSLYRTNATFTERELLFNVASMGAYDRLGQFALWNGVFNFGCIRLNTSGEEALNAYYYMLDGSTQEAQVSNLQLPLTNHGDAFLAYSPDPETLQWYIDSWDPKTNTMTHLCIADLVNDWDGYYGTEYAIVRRGSMICCYNYADGIITPIIDTGLEGDVRIICLPDCIVMTQDTGAEHFLHFYNWSFENVGSVKLDFPLGIYMLSDVICGETEDRIILSPTSPSTPEYYIEKSDFGTGNIEIHPYTLPKLEHFEQAREEAARAQE